jgi:hypothetical protein
VWLPEPRTATEDVDRSVVKVRCFQVDLSQAKRGTAHWTFIIDEIDEASPVAIPNVSRAEAETSPRTGMGM